MRPRTRVAGFITALATQGDAHLASYTLACFDTAKRAFEASPPFLAAAANLGSWRDAILGVAFEA